jgi:hypothetical protein
VTSEPYSPPGAQRHVSPAEANGSIPTEHRSAGLRELKSEVDADGLNGWPHRTSSRERHGSRQTALGVPRVLGVSK